MENSTKLNKIEDLLSRGIEVIVGKEELRKKLIEGKSLRVKLGIDPTGKEIHIGRATILWKLKDFQDLGCKIVLVIGDFTATIGDASDKEAMRKVLTREQIMENLEGYLDQIGKIIDVSRAEIHYNSEWHDALTISKLMEMAQKYTVQQMIQRRNFKERWDAQKPIGLHEIFYPIFQGYDSIMIKSDVEIGGFDQLFNLQAGRFLQEVYGQEPQSLMLLKMIDGLDGRKMSTSEGNVITINAEPNDMFGKVMSMKDDRILDYLETCTRIPLDEIKKISEGEIDYRNLKARLGEEIVKSYYGEEVAKKARDNFDNLFKNKEIPEDIPEIKISEKEIPILDLLLKLDLVTSKQEARRLVEQGGVKINSEVKKDWKEEIQIGNDMIIQVGKRKFTKIKNP